MAHNCSSAIKDTARIQNAIANFCALYLSTGFTLKQNHSDNPNPKRCKDVHKIFMVGGARKQSQLGVCGGGL